MTTKKKCVSCGEVKDLPVSFKRVKANRDGFSGRCKVCLAAYQRSYRNTPAGKLSQKAYDAQEKYKEARRRANHTPAAKAAKKRYQQSDAGRESQERYRKSDKGRATNANLKRQYLQEGRYAEEKRAYNAVYHAVKTGKLIRPEVCPKCGCDDRRIQAHHEDYSKPLEVTWLCSGCHADVHHG